MNNLTDEQRKLCEKYGAPFSAVSLQMKIGVALNVKTVLKPLNGLRHPVEAGTSGWYLWARQTLSKEPDFFVPLHTEHLAEWCPEALKYLGLPPGWRFLTDGNHEGVWEDTSLLNVHGHK